MSGFKMDDYVDVAERIRVFSEKYPDGSLQSHVWYQEQPAGWVAVAKAYREPSDERPGVGHAFEPVPGKTPYTKDSECMNAETAAWGRAIIALGFPSKKIASAQEVRARQEPASPPAQGAAPKAPEGTPPSGATPSAEFDALMKTYVALGGKEASRAGKDEAWVKRQIPNLKAGIEKLEAEAKSQFRIPEGAAA